MATTKTTYSQDIIDAISEIKETVLALVSDENGDINLDMLKAIYSSIGEMTKEEKNKVKNAEAENKVLRAKYAPAYYASLKVGQEFSYKKSTGEITVLTKVESKSKSGKTAAGLLIGWNPDLPENEGKRGARYPKFETVLVPQSFIDEQIKLEEQAKANAEKAKQVDADIDAELDDGGDIMDGLEELA